MKYKQRYDDEGFVVPSGQIYRIACCDCGLVHDFVFVSDNNTPIGIASRRNNRATGQRRRKVKINNWISVEKKLPFINSSVRAFPESETVIVYTKEGRVFPTVYSWLGWANLNSRTDKVTHWMPLPSPPVSQQPPTTDLMNKKF